MRIVVMSMSVCLSVCSHNSKTTRPNFAKYFVHAACGPGWVLLWRHCDMLYVLPVLEMTLCFHIMIIWRVMYITE